MSLEGLIDRTGAVHLRRRQLQNQPSYGSVAPQKCWYKVHTGIETRLIGLARTSDKRWEILQCLMAGPMKTKERGVWGAFRRVFFVTSARLTVVVNRICVSGPLITP